MKEGKTQRVVAIETSCDDTSLAIVCQDGKSFSVEKMLSWSQLSIHQEWGGVVPELAARSHIEKIPLLVEKMDINRKQIDAIAVTAYPGLPSALTVGVNAAYILGAMHDKPVIDVHHIMGHVFSVLLGRSLDDISLPYCVLTVSGGHNDIYLVEAKNASTKASKQKNFNEEQWHKKDHIELGGTIEVGPFHITKLSQTGDDAAGEVFDKVARMLGGPYPGGKWIGEQAEKYNPDKSDQTSADQKLTQTISNALSTPTFNDQQFSFSGLKSQVYNLVEKMKQYHGSETLHEATVVTIAYFFQERIIKALVNGFEEVIQEYNPATIGLVGGVSANLRLRERMQEKFDKEVLLPEKFSYCTDNAGMIGVVGLLQGG